MKHQTCNLKKFGGNKLPRRKEWVNNQQRQSSFETSGKVI